MIGLRTPSIAKTTFPTAFGVRFHLIFGRMCPEDVDRRGDFDCGSVSASAQSAQQLVGPSFSLIDKAFVNATQIGRITMNPMTSRGVQKRST